jgi:muramidase (phage lysozyme)
MANSIKTGVASLAQHHSTTTPPTNGAPGAFTARVTFVLYDETDKTRFDKYGGYEGIGTIECVTLVHDMQQGGEPVVARPLHTNHRKFPLINEIVEIVPAANIQAQNPKGALKVSYYYGDIVGVWDSPEHNATPDESYMQQNKPVTGDRFEEKGSVRKLMHTPGDITYESRFGSSIRMGGTHNSMKYAPWTGDNGKPVLVIMNGQKQTKEESWLPTFEDINSDGSSLYMLSGHRLPFIPASTNFASHHQSVSTKDKSKFIIGSKQPTDDTTSAQQSDGNVQNAAAADNPVIVPQSGVSGSLSPVDEEIYYLPEFEDKDFSQELEDTVIPVTNGMIATISPVDNVDRFRGNEVTNPLIKDAQKLLTKPPNKGLSDPEYIRQFAGAVSSVPGITRNGKALLDLIAVAEGTIGRCDYNGYDMIVGDYKFPGFNSPDASLPHPRAYIYIRQLDISTKGRYKYSCATGRYQFIYDGNSGVWKSWAIDRYGLVNMSKSNQDFICWSRVTIIRRAPIELIEKMDTDYNAFCTVIDKISGEYASLPSLVKGDRGQYGQGGRDSFGSLFSKYKLIIAKYNAQSHSGGGIVSDITNLFKLK